MTAIPSPTPEASGGGARGAAFAAARRHSARVRTLRWLLPAGAAGIVLVAAGGWLASLVALPDMDVGGVALEDGQIAMRTPVLRGEDQDGRPYELTAEQAFQTVSADPVIVLRALTGRIAISDSDTATVTAPQARFDSAASLVHFDEGGVEVRLASGGAASLGVTVIDLDAGTLASDVPVTVTNTDVILEAGSVRAFDGGERLVFSGDVRMILTPQTSGGAPQGVRP